MKKKNLALLFLLIVSFFAGFIVHALFFPAVLTNNILLYTKRAFENKKVTPIVEDTNKSLTKVVYEDGQFDPQVVVIGKSYYVAITNMSSTEYMNLTSDNPLLTTPRDYGKSEEVRAQLYEPGVYTVSSKLHPEHSLKIIVR